MKNNNEKGKTIFLTVVGVLTLLIGMVGASFAFFSTRIEGEAAQQDITTGKVSQLQFTPTGFGVAEENILPGKVLGNRQFEVKAVGEISPGLNIKYDCEISSVNGGITDLEYRVSAADAAMSGEVWAPVPTEATSLFTSSKPVINSTNTGDIYKVELRFKETGLDQNTQQNKTANVNIACKLADGDIIYYNDGNANGNKLKPSKQ